MKYTHLLHVSDIHIRLYQRHDEYRAVFSKLYEQFKKFPDISTSLIVVSGDLVHNKTDMSPEMFLVATEFLKSLSEIAPVVIFAGNHDASLKNLNRLDAITPMVDAINSKTIHYLKTSGKYTFDNVDFFLHSILEEESEWPVVEPLTNNNVSVGLYHGPIAGSVTDVGYIMSDDNTNYQLFSRYDMTLLGDIHKCQQVGNINAWYASSLIQQNHGETLNGHGYLVWDIRAPSQTPTFVNVANTYGYVTIDLEKNSKLPPHLPANIRLRIRTLLDASAVRKFVTIMKKHHTILDVSVLRNKAALPAQASDSNVISNIHDVTVQNTIIKKHLSDTHFTISNDVLKDVLALNTRMNTEVGRVDSALGTTWRPLQLSFDNLFSYGTGNTIDFENMHGLYGLFSANASGKSSAINALCYTLFDKTPTAFKGGHIINKSATSFRCELVFEVEDVRYKIVREGTRKLVEDVEVKVNVFFYQWDSVNNNWENLGGTLRRETNEIIRAVIGEYEDFILTALSVQNQNGLFIDRGQVERKELLSQFMGLSIFDRLSDVAQSEHRLVNDRLKTAMKKYDYEVVSKLQTHLEKDRADSVLVEATTAAHIATQDILEAELRALYTQLYPIPAGMDTSTSQLESNILKIRKTALITEKLLAELIPVDASIIDIDAEQRHIDTCNAEIASAERRVRTLESAVTKSGMARAAIRKMTSQLDDLAKFTYNPECDICLSNPTFNVISDLKASIETYTADIVHDTAPAEIVLETDTISNHKRIIKRHELAISEYILNTKHIKEYTRVKNQYATAIAESAVQIDACQLRIRELTTFERHIQKNAELTAEINSRATTLQSVKSEIQSGRASSAYHEKRIYNIQKDMDYYRELSKEIADLEKSQLTYKTYLTAISKDGIPFSLLNTVVPKIETIANELLANAADFLLSFSIDDKKVNCNIVYPDGSWSIEVGSGMERFVSGLAIRTALTQISALPKPNFLVIDEGFGVLDSDNLRGTAKMLEVLKNEYDFMIVISHLETMRDVVDHQISIKKDASGSSITI